MNKTMDVVFAFLMGLAQRFLARVAQNLWDELWEQVIAGVAWAEEKWVEAGRGAEKRAWVIDNVMAFIDERAKLGWLQRQIVRLFLGRVVDAIVETANEELGEDWVTKVQELERALAAKFPLVN